MKHDAAYTPAAGHHWLTPLYDLGVAALTREGRWRSALVAQLQPKSRDVIIDVGCGTGKLLKRIGEAALDIQLLGIDPDPAMLKRTQKTLATAGLSVRLHLGFARQTVGLLVGVRPTKVVSSLVFHQVPLAEKAAAFEAIYAALEEGGEIHIADYGLQRTRLMRALFRTFIQNLDGVVNTAPNARGILPDLMHAAGFRCVEETLVIPTPSGSISLYRGIR